ncbi:MAG: hypothetical protein DMD62_03015 [Gemmatimonadetes bacterium]|nr:MAG: hypothetical protein DMD62_03015 [Gemmatimonadota bacterium]
MKLIACVAGLLVGCTSQRSAAPRPIPQSPSRIDGEVNVTTRTGTFSARLTYSYVAGDSAEPVVRLNLASGAQLDTVACATCTSFDFDRQSRDPTLSIALARPLASHERIDLRFVYRAPLEEAWDSAHAYVELGLDNLWFPVPPNVTSRRFTYHMIVRSDLRTSELVSNGSVRKTEDDWLVTSTTPDIDIDLVFSPNIKIVADTAGGYDLRIASTNPAEDDAPALLAHIRHSLDFLNRLLGAADPLRRVTAVVRPYSVEGQGGYARNGYFVMTKGRNTGDDLHYVAHELSHHWWLQAGRREAWLNESFAEYTAMMAIRSLSGPMVFDALMREKEQQSQGLPPIYGFDRAAAPRLAPGMFYRKGPVVLHQLETELGESVFMRFLQAVIAARVKDTDTLVNVLARVASQDVADRFMERLKQ